MFRASETEVIEQGGVAVVRPKSPFNLTANTRRDRPTRLADGLGLESTLVP